jgi:hypothetical protein
VIMTGKSEKCLCIAIDKIFLHSNLSIWVYGESYRRARDMPPPPTNNYLSLNTKYTVRTLMTSSNDINGQFKTSLGNSKLLGTDKSFGSFRG